MSREQQGSRDDHRDIRSQCDRSTKTRPTTTTYDHNATARDKGVEEGRDRAMEVVLPPPSPQVRACQLCEAVTDPSNSSLARIPSLRTRTVDPDDDDDDDDAHSMPPHPRDNGRRRRRHPRPQPTGCAVGTTTITWRFGGAPSSRHRRATSFDVCPTFATSCSRPSHVRAHLVFSCLRTHLGSSAHLLSSSQNP